MADLANEKQKKNLFKFKTTRKMQSPIEHWLVTISFVSSFIIILCGYLDTDKTAFHMIGLPIGR